MRCDFLFVILVGLVSYLLISPLNKLREDQLGPLFDVYYLSFSEFYLVVKVKFHVFTSSKRPPANEWWRCVWNLVEQWIESFPLILSSSTKHIFILLYNILSLSGGGCPFHPSVSSSVPSSKFLILEEEDDGRGGGQRMAAAAVYPNVYVIQYVFSGVCLFSIKTWQLV